MFSFLLVLARSSHPRKWACRRVAILRCSNRQGEGSTNLEKAGQGYLHSHGYEFYWGAWKIGAEILWTKSSGDDAQ